MKEKRKGNEMRTEKKNKHSLTCSIKINETMGTNSLIKALIVNTVWMDNAFFWLLRYYPVTGTVFTSTPYRRYFTAHTNSIWLSFDVQFNLVSSYLLLQRFSLFKFDSSFFSSSFSIKSLKIWSIKRLIDSNFISGDQKFRQF